MAKIEVGDLGTLPIIIGYTLCSSLLAVANKAAVDVFPFPSLLTALQYLTCVIVVYILGKLKYLDLDPLEWGNIKAFFPAAFCFYLAIFTNTTLLRYANLDTFIVFRSSCPILVAVADTIFRNQPWPSSITFVSLFTILLGAVGYVVTDSQYSVRAYTWATVYLTIMTFDMVYIKHIVTNLKLSTWGLVLYNNFIALMVAPAFWALTGEFRDTSSADVRQWVSFGILGPVILSCILGFAISFFGFSCRRAVSATSFTVLGVANKLITVIVNVTIWDKHASAFGIFCLLVTIFGGVLYQQSVSKAKGGPTAASPKEESQSLISKHHDSDNESLSKKASI